MNRFAKISIRSLVIFTVLSGLVLPAGAQETGAAPPGSSSENALVVAAKTLLDSIQQNMAEIAQLREESDQAQGEERVLLERRRLRKGIETLTDVDALVKNVLAQEEQGLDAAVFRKAAEDLVGMLAPIVRERVASLRDEISELSAQRVNTTGEALIRLEQELTVDNEEMTTVLDAGLNNAEHMEALGLAAAGEKAFLAEELSERAATAAERIRLSLEQISALQERLQEKPGDADIETALSAAVEKKEASRAELTATIGMMDRLELETSEYQQLLIEATGAITTDILDTEVALGLFQQWLIRLKDWTIESGPGLIFRAIVFVLILFVFHLLARLTRKIVRKAVSTSKLGFSQLLQNMFVSISGNVLMVVGLLVALSQLGFALGPILAGLGIAGFIVGFALQETLANFAAGMMILIYRPFDVGDMVEAAGVFGEVSAMSMVSTTVLTIDNQTLVVPNGKIWGDVIKNVTAQKVRRVDMVFGVSYTDDIPKTEKVLAAILDEHPKVLDNPESLIKLHTLGESSVDFVVRPWVKTDDYWDVYWDVTREVKMRFDKEGISIPFPQRDVHLYEEKSR
jgi:small conductance mechanosensitive channel